MHILVDCIIDVLFPFNELDRRQDGHATLAVARILNGVHKALKGATEMVLTLVSESAGEMAEMTRYMSQVDFVFGRRWSGLQTKGSMGKDILQCWPDVDGAPGLGRNVTGSPSTHGVLEGPCWTAGTDVAAGGEPKRP